MHAPPCQGIISCYFPPHTQPWHFNASWSGEMSVPVLLLTSLYNMLLSLVVRKLISEGTDLPTTPLKLFWFPCIWQISCQVSYFQTFTLVLMNVHRIGSVSPGFRGEAFSSTRAAAWVAVLFASAAGSAPVQTDSEIELHCLAWRRAVSIILNFIIPLNSLLYIIKDKWKYL